MKITVSVDLEDLYINEDQSLNEALENKIKREVINDIWISLKTKVEDQIQRKVSEEVEKLYCKKIQGFISEFFETGTLKSQKNSNERISIKEWILYQFEINSGWNNPKDQIEKLAKVHATELKNRFDLMFASQLVAKLNENGLLKEDVARLLLDK